MNKNELLAQISALEDALTAKNITFEKVNREATNAELEKEIERLESLISDDDAQLHDKTDQDNNETLATVVDEKRVRIAKGVNVEMTHKGQKQILKSEQTYTLPIERATSLVAEKLGVFIDESV